MTRDEIMQLDDDALRVKIALLRGGVVYQDYTGRRNTIAPKGNGRAYGGIVDNPEHGYDLFIDWDFPDWPRDKAAAIDLLDSMTYPPEPDGTVVKVEYVIYRETYIHTGGVWPLAAPVYNVEIFGRNPINGEDFDATGDTLALAASRAWLMWKDGK